MSFPHRTAFYNKEKDEIFMPNEAKRLDNDYIVENDGRAMSFHKGMEVYGPDDNLISLASTGLSDRDDNEVFEGHVVNNAVIYWSPKNYGFKLKGVGFDLPLHCLENQSKREQFEMWDSETEITIEGHVTTDPELVPDSFDVDDYFDLEAE